MLEDIGSVFTDFSVGELPAQHFSDYGEVVRRRMKQENERKITPIRAATHSRLWKACATAAAAACLTFAALHFVPSIFASSKLKLVGARPARDFTPIPPSTRLTPIKVFNDLYPAATKTREFDPEQSKGLLNELQNDESKYGYLIFPEMPLLGIQLRTMRDMDRDVSGNNARLGLRVHANVPDGVANEMGLREGDVIVCINRMNVNSGSAEDAVHFLNAVNNLGKGAVVTIDFLRQDKCGVQYVQRSGVLGEPKATFE